MAPVHPTYSYSGGAHFAAPVKTLPTVAGVFSYFARFPSSKPRRQPLLAESNLERQNVVSQMASGVLHLSPGIKTGIMTVSHEKLYMDNDWHYYTHMENDQALSNTYGG